MLWESVALPLPSGPGLMNLLLVWASLHGCLHPALYHASPHTTLMTWLPPPHHCRLVWQSLGCCWPWLWTWDVLGSAILVWELWNTCQWGDCPAALAVLLISWLMLFHRAAHFCCSLTSRWYKQFWSLQRMFYLKYIRHSDIITSIFLAFSVLKLKNLHYCVWCR